MKTILVIEDEQTVRESILDLLEAEGFHGIGGENGDIGVKLAHEHHPDLILCDVTMPELDGFSVLAQLRKSPDTAGIPFIFLSARSTKSDQRQGMELGADDYLTKPCTATDLLGAVSGRLAKYAAMAERYLQKVEPAKSEKTESVVEPSGADSPQISGTRDGLLNHFYQELRNPLSNINMALHLLKLERIGHESTIATVQREYGRELAVLQAVYKLQDYLMPESAELLRNCHLMQLISEETT
ncbi:MAG: response regulator [Plectolyngbya sp. WJT66-NPBG17]|jgi:DNA-binding response OmpR family regulator|nr:response regulator [Plectolyngbya sp. WJT66-NPBG17]MBW4527829.1 response regulator [Phormidium tanganyikae FI6-MK23]